ncbi:FAD-binding protein [Pelagibacterium montanilacus]|uniref:FAD-binding protein n=1 Tax=Pelagibacterium montanilacus TaxID=2185280 RepID=UPI000F8D4D08|nr:FAD-binding protein [Pelagibacterium montanilacus]
MSTLYVPASEDELAELVSRAAGTGERFAIRGGATRGAIGGRAEGSELTTTGLSGITLYEPAEMVIAARAGTPLAEVEAALADKGQMLPFEPMDHRGLLGTEGTPTIGALAAANISGPRRVAAGSARDHLIGIRMVNGRGEIIKSGGRVTKNVTGLDLVKLNAGACGTLGVLTEVTFKVLPRPQSAVTLAARGLAPEGALTALADALATPFEVSAAAYIEAADAEPSMTLVRIEGFSESCAYRSERLSELLAHHGAFAPVGDEEGAKNWRRVGNARDFAAPNCAAVLRVHVAPSKAPSILELAQRLEARVMADWGGGLIWLGLGADASVEAAMAGIAERGGHPMVVRCAADTDWPLIGPGRAVAELGKRVKAAFDPQALFNPGVLAGYL